MIWYTTVMEKCWKYYKKNIWQREFPHQSRNNKIYYFETIHTNNSQKCRASNPSTWVFFRLTAKTVRGCSQTSTMRVKGIDANLQFILCNHICMQFINFLRSFLQNNKTDISVMKSMGDHKLQPMHTASDNRVE